VTALLAGALLAAAGPAAAQQPAPDPYAQPVPAPPEPAAPPLPSIRQLFASTLAAVATAGGSALTIGLTQAITGGLTSWFNRKLKVDPNAAASGYPPGYATGQTPPYQAAQRAYPSAQPYPPVQDPSAPQPYPPVQDPYAQQAYPPPQTYPPQDPGAQPAYPAQPDYGATQAYPPAQQYPAPAGGQHYPSPDGAVQYYDAYTGAAAAPDPAFAAAASGAGHGALYAGLAFEVHAVQPGGGGTFPVDPSSHEFRTGDRFVVYYRPTLPGRMDVYNINPAGQQSLIDSVQIAAGQLAQLGPYEFAALTGDEQLKLVLQPCTTAALTSATRDIVNVAQPDAAPALGLAACGPATRSARAPRTRDIRKVALEGTTGFALDAVSPQERASGLLDAREVTIVFRHR
jgi:hypothetical protein